MFKGKRYCLTRLGFGLNVAPLVMKAVLNKVLDQSPSVRQGTSAYVDDVLVREDKVKENRAEEGRIKLPVDSTRLAGLTSYD